MNLPKDSVILLGFLNLKLRDEYSSLRALCEDLDADREGIEAQMRAFGYVYSEQANAFVRV